MIAAPTANSLITHALPESKALRLATQLGLALAGTLVLTIAAKTKVPLGIVDMNLGTLAVLLIGAAFGWRLAVATVLLYLAEGALGLPVFQGTPEKGIGLAYMIGSTGGYLAGYVLMAGIVGWAADRGWDRNVFKLFGAMLVAEIVMMSMGFGWLATLIGTEKAWQFGVAPFILVDLIKIALASALLPAAWSLINRFRAAD